MINIFYIIYIKKYRVLIISKINLFTKVSSMTSQWFSFFPQKDIYSTKWTRRISHHPLYQAPSMIQMSAHSDLNIFRIYTVHKLKTNWTLNFSYILAPHYTFQTPICSLIDLIFFLINQDLGRSYINSGDDETNNWIHIGQKVQIKVSQFKTLICPTFFLIVVIRAHLYLPHHNFCDWYGYSDDKTVDEGEKNVVIASFQPNYDYHGDKYHGMYTYEAKKTYFWGHVELFLREVKQTQ